MIKYFAIFDNYLMCYSFNQLLAFYMNMKKSGSESLILCVSNAERFTQYEFCASELRGLNKAYVTGNIVLFKKLMFGDIGDRLALYFDDAELGIDGYNSRVKIENVGKVLSTRDLMLNGGNDIVYSGIKPRERVSQEQIEAYSEGSGINYRSLPCSKYKLTVAEFKITGGQGDIDKRYNSIKSKLDLSGVELSKHDYFNGMWYSLDGTILPTNSYAYMGNKHIAHGGELELKSVCFAYSKWRNTKFKIDELMDSNIKCIDDCRCKIDCIVFSNIEHMCDSKIDIGYLANTILDNISNCIVTFNVGVHRLCLEEFILDSKIVFNCDIKENAFSWIDTRHREIAGSTFIFNKNVNVDELHRLLGIMSRSKGNKIRVRHNVLEECKSKNWYNDIFFDMLEGI